VLAKFLVDLEKQQSITSSLNVKANLKETDYHKTFGEFHNYDTKIQLVSKATIVAKQQGVHMKSHHDAI
jgi:hypothetical protein